MILRNSRTSGLRRQSLPNRPTQLYSSRNRSSGNFELLSPFGLTHRLSVKGEIYIRPFVTVLLGGCCPANIGWFIAEIVIYAIKAMLWRRTWSNIGKKVGKRRPPLLAYKDASSTVMAIRRVRGIQASLDHSRPSVVFGSVASSMTEMSHDLWLFITTAGKSPAMQSSGVYIAFSAAVAEASPHLIVSLVYSKKRDYNKSFESCPWNDRAFSVASTGLVSLYRSRTKESRFATITATFPEIFVSAVYSIFSQDKKLSIAISGDYWITPPSCFTLKTSTGDLRTESCAVDYAKVSTITATTPDGMATRIIKTNTFQYQKPVASFSWCDKIPSHDRLLHRRLCLSPGATTRGRLSLYHKLNMESRV